LQLATEWFYQKDGAEIGPVSAADLRQLASTGELQPTDPVRKADMDRWAKASALKGLFPAADTEVAPPPPAKPQPTAKPPSPPPKPIAPAGNAKTPVPAPAAKAAAPTRAKPKTPPPQVAAEEEPAEESETTPAKKSRSRWIWYAVAAVVLLGGTGGVYLYLLYQENRNMSVGPGPMPLPRATAAPAFAPTVAPKPVNRALTEIISDKPMMRVVGFRHVLAQTEIPDEDRDAIHKAACDTVADKKQNQAWILALQVLGRTGTPDDMKLVTPLATHSGPDTESVAIAAAMLISPDDGVKLYEPHAGEMLYNGVLNDVSKGGPRCEPALLALLKSNKRVCRYQALGLLGFHGSAKAIDPINQAKENETDPTLMSAYQDAIDGINARIAKK
jgi:hypothetical protein